MRCTSKICLRNFAPRKAPAASTSDWETALARWAHEELARIAPGSGKPLLDTAIPRFERIVIEAALARSGGRRRDASVLLGWGRNTLTRKMKELEMNVGRRLSRSAGNIAAST